MKEPIRMKVIVLLDSYEDSSSVEDRVLGCLDTHPTLSLKVVEVSCAPKSKALTFPANLGTLKLTSAELLDMVKALPESVIKKLNRQVF